MNEKRLYLLRMGPTLPELAADHGEFDDWMRPHLGWPAQRVRTLRPYLDEPLPPAETVAGAVMTGAAFMVTEGLPWMRRTEAWVLRLASAGVPLLGICFGHQLLAQALGGEVGYNPRGPEAGTVSVRWQPAAGGDPLLGGLPTPTALHASHQQSVLRLPPGAVHLAASDGDPHHAFRVGARAWGLQFHPEFDGTATRAYIHQLAEPLRRCGQDPQLLLAAVADRTDGPLILQRFGALVAAGHA